MKFYDINLLGKYLKLVDKYSIDRGKKAERNYSMYYDYCNGVSRADLSRNHNIAHSSVTRIIMRFNRKLTGALIRESKNA